MKSMKVIALGFVSAITLAGCGGGSSNGTPAQTPYANGQYNGQYNQTAQPYTCQAGMIQLRNAFGQSQCYQTTDLASACAQASGQMVGAQCRKERQITGSSVGKFRNNGSMAADRIPLRVNTFAGESIKIYGKIDSLHSDQEVLWNAQLIQAGAVVGSASGDTNRTGDIANLSITSTSTLSNQYNQPQYNYQNQYPQGQYPNQYPQGQYPNQYPQGQYPNQYPQGQYPNPYQNGGYAIGYNQQAQATPNQLILEIMFQGKVRVELHATAISCEDGRGNSYPCQ
jgi:hypothetical protein